MQVLILFPMIYYFSHPEPYHMRTLDPLLLILVCSTIVACASGRGTRWVGYG